MASPICHSQNHHQQAISSMSLKVANNKTKAKNRKSLATQLTWLSILVVTLVAFSLGSGLIYIAAQAQRDSAFRLQQNIALQAAQLISGYIGKAVDRLRFYLDNSQLASMPALQQKASLDDLLITSLPLFSQLAILDKHGEETAKVSRFHTFLPEEMANQVSNPAFITAIGGETYIGTVAFLGNTGLLSVSVALPIRGPSSKINGVLIAAVNVHHLWQQVARIKVGQSGYAFLVDRNGKFVAYQKLAEVLQRHGEDMQNMRPVADFIASERDIVGQVHEYEGLIGEEVIGVYAPVKGTDWAVLIEQPASEAYAGIIRMQNYLFALAFAGIIMAGGLGYFISRRIIGPIRALTEAAQLFGSGDLHTEFVSVKRQDEVGVLSHAFQVMQKELKELYAGLKTKVIELETMQRALHKSELKYRSIFENATEGIFQSTPEGRYLSVNPALSKMMGYESPQEMIDQVRDISSQLYVNPEDRKALQSALKEHGKIEGYEVMQKRKDGSTIILSLNSHLVHDSDSSTIYYEGTVKDITLKRKAEEEQEKAWSMLQAAITQSPSGIVIAEAPDGEITLANPQALNIRGGEETTLTHIDFSQYTRNWQLFDKDGNVFPSEDLPLTRAIVNGETTINKEMIIRNEYGEDRWIFVNAAPIRNKAGDITSGIAVFQDVTDLKRTEEARAKLESQLRQAQKMEAVGTLAGGIAHDFNNILSAIMGYGELAQLASEEGQNNHRHLDQIVKAAERAKSLVKQMLTYSRRSEMELRPVDINLLVTRSFGMLERAIPKMININSNLSDDLALVKADSTLMEQVIMNLANNASDAMPDGGRLTFETSLIDLDLDYIDDQLEIAPGRYVLLTVTDTGQGMDKETLEKIFDPFFTTKDIGKGTGLGLSTVFGITKEHGGHISCYSEPGLGTTFKIYLPVMQVSRDDLSVQNIPSQDALGGNETILLVDDEEAIRELGAELLENMGYRVIKASSGEEALEYYRQANDEVDLVVLDLGMPGMGGHKCIKALLEISPGLKVLIASGYSANGTVADTLRQGAAGYIPKPFRRNDLLNTVRNILDD
jgi:PAS domain S-box-containing protein